MRILISTLLLLVAITTLFATTTTHQQEIPQLTSSNVDFCQSIVDNFLMFRPTASPPPTTRAPAAIATQSTTTTSTATTTTTSTPITTTSTATSAVNTTSTSVQPDTVAENAHDNNNKNKNDLMTRRELALDLLNEEVDQGEDQTNSNNKNDFVETSLQPPSVTAPQPTLPPVRVPIFPITYKISSHLNSVFQTDVISRLQQVSQNGAPQLGPQPPQGSSFTAQYRFFQTLAFATQGLDNVIRNFEGLSIWVDLISKFSSSSSSTKPYILNIQNIINQVVSSNSNNNNNQQQQKNSVWGFSDVSSQTGATFSDLRERLAVGFLTVVALQSNNRQNAMCSGFLQKVSSPPWPLVQSRTILSIVVGIDTSFIYLTDPCSNEIAKLKLDEFSQRWHNFEVTNDVPTVPVSVVRRTMYFSVANVTQSMMRVVKQNYEADDIFSELSVINVRDDL